MSKGDGCVGDNRFMTITLTLLLTDFKAKNGDIATHRRLVVHAKRRLNCGQT